MKVAVLGAGNGGQAISAYLSMQGHNVSLWDRNQNIVDELIKKGGVRLEGCINGFGAINIITNNLKTAICDAQIIMIVTTANAHGYLAVQLADLLQEGQIVVLNPGRTGGVLEFRESLKKLNFSKKIFLAETQTLIYACRTKETGVVNIIGIKDKVFLSALPSKDTSYVLKKIQNLYTCFIAANNVLVTGLENIGAVFHPSVIIFNAAAIERGNKFYFYREMTSAVAEFIEKLDDERLAIGKAYGIDLISAKQWVSFAYKNIKGDSLCERMQNNPAYYDILAPESIHCRQLLEDIPTGIMPLIAFGEIAGVKTQLLQSVLTIASVLLQKDFTLEGRNLTRLGLNSCRSVLDVIKIIDNS
ncbi:MAG TPA: NAD/NADP octopine/nopaline dehydrogenase family protein [Bacteroidales bacterium]|nr:NAD(P)-binding domain-containing protein [Bacteroidales bacterium]HOS17302.1 NAD/NADP octopine/nopaline dehydrogenase family protein [Bacteroidales bacterium]